ncbi:MAG: threonine--tRNA ligase [Dehalococcoidia bacterium]|nr:threonine--tRNA ligase [Dehalococcoidia bacterium]|tara:strand:+ start:1167 stop:2936 length:1770 start_codon:yes stop_codon:yes gene_type:complete
MTPKSSTSEFPTADYYDRLRHSVAHIMADAVLQRYPGTKLGVGPTIENGFYYDFQVDNPFTPDDLIEIEKSMQKIIDLDLAFESRAVPRSEAISLLQDQPFKKEIVNDLDQEEEITFYRHGKFDDLCEGPHLQSTGQVPSFKLLSTAGAYWRGDEQRPMLQRIYGTAWESSDQLDSYLQNLEEAQKRDHRKLGRQLDLFSVQDETGPGLILWHPKGARIRTIIEDYMRQEHYSRGYELVYTPHVGKAKLWETSGHLDYYRELMYASMNIEGQEYFLKPMNCPFHIMVYETSKRSYRDLPIRLAELGTVYRYERTGVLHGLMRVRGFTQDDAHIFCRPDQIHEEIIKVLSFTFDLFKTFGFNEFDLMVSTRPKKFVGSVENWDLATESLKTAIEEFQIPYGIDEGGGAFYGPKIDIQIRDAIGRSWQCTTVQFDFNLPDRFDLSYVGSDGQTHRPYMVHRALLGSVERFFGVLLEHYAGSLPLWLAPTQVVIIPIADRHLEYVEKLANDLGKALIRTHIDQRNERMNLKIREAQAQKVPYMLIIGDKEIESNTVSIRQRDGAQLDPMPSEEFLSRVVAEIALRGGNATES